MNTSSVTYKLCLISVMCALSSVVCYGVDGEWISVGGPNYLPRVGAISAGYDGDTYLIYAADSSATATVLRSTDRGVSWSFSLTFGDVHSDVKTHPSNAAVAYALNPYSTNDPYDGIWVTTDRGLIWRHRTEEHGITNMFLECVYVIRSEPTGSRALVGCNSYENLDVILYTTDTGDSWAPLSRVGLPDVVIARSIAVDEDDNSYIYFVNSQTGAPEGVVFRSTNSGESWSSIATEEDFPEVFIPSVKSIAKDPSDRNVVFILVTGNYAWSYVYFTRNAQAVNPEDDVFTAYVGYVQYPFGDRAVSKTLDGGRNWLIKTESRGRPN